MMSESSEQIAPAGQADPESPALRQSGRNGGWLKRGGKNPRAGRPPSAIKARCLRDFDDLRPLLRRIARDDEARVADRLRAIDVLGRYGLDHSVSLADVRQCLIATRRELVRVVPNDQLDALWAKVLRHWLKL
jgi:hypothetical protein